jgi:DNA-directed RNA polymerase subunit RPC12/RpoP
MEDIRCSSCGFSFVTSSKAASTCPKCGHKYGHKGKKSFIDRLFGREKKKKIGKSNSNISSLPSSDFSNLRLVLALSKAVQKKFEGHQTDMTAAVLLAMIDKNRDDIVERSEGIYLSRHCADRISSYEVWLANDGEIIITRRKFKDQIDKPKKDSQRFLNEHLPKARMVGRLNSFHYALGVVLTFGLDQDRLLVQKDGTGVVIY